MFTYNDKKIKQKTEDGGEVVENREKSSDFFHK